ncbi:putative leader peptide [Jannaschia sp. R86511]
MRLLCACPRCDGLPLRREWLTRRRHVDLGRLASSVCPGRAPRSTRQSCP